MAKFDTLSCTGVAPPQGPLEELDAEALLLEWVELLEAEPLLEVEPLEPEALDSDPLEPELLEPELPLVEEPELVLEPLPSGSPSASVPPSGVGVDVVELVVVVVVEVVVVGVEFVAVVEVVVVVVVVDEVVPEPDDELQPSLRTQLERYRTQLGTGLPLGVLQVFLRCWVMLYGTVTLEVFGHMRFALDDSTPMFELMLSDLAGQIGLNYRS